MQKTDLSERDICTKLITPAILLAGWKQEQFREEVKLTPGRVIVRGKVAQRVKDPEAQGGPKRSDYVLYAKPNIALATLEAKRNVFPVGHGMQQALTYAEMLDAPFAISSNGDKFLLHDRTGITTPTERELELNEFPTYDEMWTIYQQWKGMTSPDAHQLMAQPYYTDGTGKEPYYYQKVAINRVMEHISQGDQRMLLVMATGTGKTYTAFQIIWRLWKAKRMKRILFLADRNILLDQTILQDFAPFGEVMHKIVNREAKKNYEIYMALYQAITGTEDVKQIFREFPADFDICPIETQVTQYGATLKKQPEMLVPRRDRRTKAKQYKELDADFTYTSGQLDRDVVVDSQIRLVIRTFKEKLFTEIFPDRTVVPQILVFAKTYLHADDSVQIIREEFGLGNDFCQKITHRTGFTKKTVKVKDEHGNEKDKVTWERSSALKPEGMEDDSSPCAESTQLCPREFATQFHQSEKLQSVIRRTMNCIAHIGRIAA